MIYGLIIIIIIYLFMIARAFRLWTTFRVTIYGLIKFIYLYKMI